MRTASNYTRARGRHSSGRPRAHVPQRGARRGAAGPLHATQEATNYRTHECADTSAFPTSTVPCTGSPASTTTHTSAPGGVSTRLRDHGDLIFIDLHDAGAVAQVDEIRDPWSRIESTHPATCASSSMRASRCRAPWTSEGADVLRTRGCGSWLLLRSGHASQSTDALGAREPMCARGRPDEWPAPRACGA